MQYPPLTEPLMEERETKMLKLFFSEYMKTKVINLVLPAFVTNIWAKLCVIKNTKSNYTRTWYDGNWVVRRFDFSKKSVWEYAQTKTFGTAKVFFIKKTSKPYYMIDSYIFVIKSVNPTNNNIKDTITLVGSTSLCFSSLKEGKLWSENFLQKTLWNLEES